MTFAVEEAGQILSQDARGRVLVSRERRESLLEEYDRSGMSGVKFAQYVGIKYSTLAYWLQSRRRHRRREKLLIKAGADTGAGKSTGGWIEAVVRSLQRLGCRHRGGQFCELYKGIDCHWIACARVIYSQKQLLAVEFDPCGQFFVRRIVRA